MGARHGGFSVYMSDLRTSTLGQQPDLHKTLAGDTRIRLISFTNISYLLF